MLLHRMTENGLWNSMRELDNMRQKLNQLLYSDTAGNRDFPALNVWVSENGAVLETELPGFEVSDIEILVVNDVLTLKGTRQTEALQEGERYHRQERGFGQFARSIQLPFSVNAEAVEAKFEKGILEINLPRSAADRPRRISVKSA
ncbi:MAG: Hsp20/alpha crystallin family protein [Candidatus Obscuribacterales bacterium]|nr:Hsp20/alpha crystallin family protein [Candidatus Obscuribacterales bacterium]